MSRRWQDQRERGSLWLMRLITWIALRLGPRIAHLLVYPICAYFVLFSPRLRRASRAYFVHLEGRRPGLGRVFRHCHHFACTLLHRIYFLADRFELFTLRVHGVQEVERILARGKGCVLLTAHLGSFEVLRAVAAQRGGLNVKALVYRGNSDKTGAVMNAIKPGLADHIIAVGASDALLDAHRHVHAGGLLSLMGDRWLREERRTRCAFLGGEAWFPTSPLTLASVVDAPVVLAFGLYRGGFEYDVYFEVLTECVERERARRARAVNAWTARYAERLEHYCRLAPENWFNFYDFWEASHET